MPELFNCPCCGKPTLDEEPPGTFDICKVCGWEDDNVQFHDPEYRGGANTESLREAREDFARFGSHSAPPWPTPKTLSELDDATGDAGGPGILRRPGEPEIELE